MKILGYANKFSIAQNDFIEFKVSCKDIKTLVAIWYVVVLVMIINDNERK